MKTRIITLITLVTALSTTSITYASTKAANNQVTVLTGITNINKIEASGNVEVYITNGDKDEVKVYDNYYAQNALVQNKDGVLRISSYKPEKLVVLVTVTDLRAITASDNASIKSSGTFTAIGFNVNLNDEASAQLKLNAFAANININDHAKADLSGSIDDYELNYSQSSTVNRAELVATNRVERLLTKSIIIPAATDDIASL